MDRKIVAFGDSLTFGHGVPEENKWTNLLEKDLGIKVINSGINGNTSAQGLVRIQEDVLDHKPDFVIINFGMNDHFLCDMGRAKVSLVEYKENILEIIKRVKDIGSSPILVLPHKVLEGGMGDEEGKGATYYYGRHNPLWYIPVGGANEQLKKYINAASAIAKEEKVPIVDMYTYTEDLKPHSYLITLENSTEEDGVHINSWGAMLYANMIKEKLLQLI